MTTHPEWIYYPADVRPPEWVAPFLAVVASAQPTIDSHSVERLTSDLVLAQLRPGLQALGFDVEAGSSATRRSAVRSCSGSSVASASPTRWTS